MSALRILDLIYAVVETLGVLLVIGRVGKPRDPITPAEAVISTLWLPLVALLLIQGIR